MVAQLRARPDDDGLDFGAMLRRLRISAGLSQTRLARTGGVNPAYVNRIERRLMGENSMPSRTVVLQLWTALETTVENRERLLVAAGHCPEVILSAGGWDAYLRRIRQHAARALAVLDRALVVPRDASEAQ